MNPPETSAATAEGAREILSLLNSLGVGEISRLQAELERARQALEGLGQADLEARVRDAQAALRSGDMKEFRRALANVTARLGHLK